MTILGTRPEIIRLSLLISMLDKNCNHILIHTGQNHDKRLSDVFFGEMGIRKPDAIMGVKANTPAQQIGQILARAEKLFVEYHPDRLAVLGDTNSALSAIVARRMGIPVYHLEAGNRCYDDRVPEEINRRIIDHSSTVLMPYTNRSRENLLREGISGDRVFVTGNPIRQVISQYSHKIEASAILAALGLQRGRFFLVTAHRAENVDDDSRLADLVDALTLLHQKYRFPMVCSLHPHTKARAQQYGVKLDREGLIISRPFGFFDFVKLEQSAFCVLTDSGTVQEETCILGTPNVTMRDVTERPETLECGSNILAGCSPTRIAESVDLVTSSPRSWRPPVEYVADNVAETMTRIILSHRQADSSEEIWVRKCTAKVAQ
jgi:UDP-N-acetylglucosamine 2-epimerase (non-hydrolysing)